MSVGILIPGLQKHILDIAATIEYGTTITYQELARQIGKPDLAKQVQAALMKNPLPLVFPCHRVVSGPDDVGNHTWGKKMKTRLLQLEAIHSKAATGPHDSRQVP